MIETASSIQDYNAQTEVETRPYKSPSLTASFGYALEGMLQAVSTERNLRIHLSISLVAITMAVVLGLSAVEWAILWGFIGLVLFAELMNTAVEKVVDMVTKGQYSQDAKAVKDIAAAAVLLTAITAVAAGLCLFLPHLLDLTQTF